MYTGSIRSPLVSVIVINYNYGRFIDQCLQSIANQTYPHIECIVFDNASSDDSMTIIRSFPDGGQFGEAGRSFKIFRSEENLFQTPAAVAAFGQCTGEFIIFFDADDIMLPTCVEAHVRALLSLRTPVGASCVDYFISAGDNLTVSSANSGFADTKTGVPSQNNLSRNLQLPPTSRGTDLDIKASEIRLLGIGIEGWPWSGTCGMCFRREIVEILFRRPPLLKEQLDAYLMIATNALTGSILIDRPLVIYRHHGKNVFASGPRIANMAFYDRTKIVDLNRLVATEIIATLTHIASYLNKYLYWNGLFFQVIQYVGEQAKLTPTLPVHSFMLSYLLVHERSLTEAFGEAEISLRIAQATRGWTDFAFTRRYRSERLHAGHALEFFRRHWRTMMSSRREKWDSIS